MDKGHIQPEGYIKPMNLTQLARLYNVSIVTFRKWLKPFQEELNLTDSKIFNPKQIKIIFQNLGSPYEKNEDI